MNKSIKQYSYKNSLAFYFNKANIPNQELVKDTFNHFETGPRKGVFNALEFLNLLDKQYQFVRGNIKESEFVFSSLKKLPLNKLEKHILFGFILKWYGGYPVNNMNKDYDKTLKLIEHEFLSYPEETFEKEFCKSDIDYKKYLMKLGIASTTAINSGVNLTVLMAGFDQEEKVIEYASFDSLFEAAVNRNLFGIFSTEEQKLIVRTKCNYDFNVWLSENKSWELGNLKEYKKYLTEEILLEFIGTWGHYKNLPKEEQLHWDKASLANNSLHSISKQIEEILQEQQKKELPLVEEVESQLRNLRTTQEKVKYLIERKEQYLHSLPLATFSASGVSSYYLPKNTELFFDRYITQRIEEIQRFEKKQVPDNNTIPPPQTFEDIFTEPDFHKYIAVFEKTKPALLNSNWHFIGKPRKHKGVICSWVREMQFLSIIKANINRSQLANVLNNEIKYFNLGKDGKSINNTSLEYKNEFKNQIKDILNLK